MHLFIYYVCKKKCIKGSASVIPFGPKSNSLK